MVYLRVLCNSTSTMFMISFLLHDRYNTIPDGVWGDVQFVISGDIEINQGGNLTTSHQITGEEGNWYMAYPGGMNVTDQHARLRFVTIVVHTDASDVQLRQVNKS